MELTCRVGAAASVCGQLFDTFGYLEYLNCKRIKAAEVTNYSLKKSIAEISDAPAKWILPFGLRTTSDSVESVRKEGLVQLRPNPLCENDDPRNDITLEADRRNAEQPPPAADPSSFVFRGGKRPPGRFALQSFPSCCPRWRQLSVARDSDDFLHLFQDNRRFVGRRVKVVEKPGFRGVIRGQMSNLARRHGLQTSTATVIFPPDPLIGI